MCVVHNFIPVRSLVRGYQAEWTIEIVPRRYKARRQRFTALTFWFVLGQAKMNKEAGTSKSFSLRKRLF